MKQLHDLYEQIEQAQLELSTFYFLQRLEMAAIPRRLEVCCFITIWSGFPSASVFNAQSVVYIQVSLQQNFLADVFCD
jgi:hypothetical protein